MSAKLIETVSVVARLLPELGSNETLATNYVDLSLYDSVAFYVSVGNATAAYNASVYQATTDQGGGPAEEIAALASSEYTSGDDNKIVIIEVRADDLKVNSGFRYVNARIAIESGGSGNHVSILGIAGKPRYVPGDHVANVVETVASE